MPARLENSIPIKFSELLGYGQFHDAYRFEDNYMLGLLTQDKKEFISQHAALLVSSGLVVVCAIRILAFAGGDVQTALAVVAVGQQFTILMGTLFSVVIGASAVVLFGMEKDIWPDPKRKGSSANSAWRAAVFGICMILVCTAMPILPVLFIVVVAVVLNVWGAIRVRRGKSAQHSGIRSVLRFVIDMAVLSLAIMTIFAPWAPLENISYLQGKKAGVVSGYVVGEQTGMVVVMEEEDKSLRWIDMDELVGRELCSKTGQPKPILLKSAFEIYKVSKRPPLEKCQSG